MKTIKNNNINNIIINICKCLIDENNYTEPRKLKTLEITNLLIELTNLENNICTLKDRKLSHPSGIMRARRKLQEEVPSLRGEIWELRHKEQEVVKKDLGYKGFEQ